MKISKFHTPILHKTKIFLDEPCLIRTIVSPNRIFEYFMQEGKSLMKSGKSRGDEEFILLFISSFGKLGERFHKISWKNIQKYAGRSMYQCSP